MKKRIKKLGFEYLEEYKTYALILKDRGLELNVNSDNIYLMNNETIMTLFPYDETKRKPTCFNRWMNFHNIFGYLK